MKKAKMPDSAVCNPLRSAFEKCTPNVLDSVVADINNNNTLCEEVEVSDYKHPLILNNRFRRIAAIAAAIVLIVTGVVGAYLLSGKTESLVTVTIEVNPEIELSVTRDDKVASVTALNDDGSTLLPNTSEYVGAECKTAVLAIVDLLIDEEYLQPHNASVLISVSGGSREKRESLSHSLEEAVGYHLAGAGLKGTVLLRTFDGKINAATKIAERHSISMGKAQLVSEIMSKSPIYTELELSRLSIQELGGILESLDPDKNKVVPVLGEVISFTPRKDADKGDPEFTPTILPEFDPDKDITKDEAKELVLAHSGAKDFPVQNYSCQKYSGGEVPVYNISFICDRYNFNYTVQIRGGVILDSEKTERETVNTLKGMTYTEGESENSIPFLVTHFYGKWSSTFDVITSKKEFYTAFPNPFPDVSYDRGTGFIGEMCRLRDSFFDEYTLLLYSTSSCSSSVSYSVPDVTLENGTITAFIDIYHPQAQRDDGVSYIYVIAVRNEDIGDCASAVTSITTEYDDGVEEPPFGEDHPIHTGSDGTEYMMRHYNYLLGSIDPYFSFDYKKYALNRDSITDSNRPVLIFTSKEETRTFIEDLEKEFTQNYSMGRYLPHDMLSLSDDFYDDYTLLLLYLTQTGNRKFIDNIVTDVAVENSTLTISLDRSFSGWGTEKEFVTMILVAVKNEDIPDLTTAKTITNDIEKTPLDSFETTEPITTEPITTEPVTADPPETTEPDLTDDVPTDIPTEITTEPPVTVPPVVVEPPITEPPVTSEPPVITEPPVTGIQPQPITKPDEARRIALEHARINGSLILGYVCEEGTENDRRVYKIEFVCGGYRYNYTIAVCGGDVLSSDKKSANNDDILKNYTSYEPTQSFSGYISYKFRSYPAGFLIDNDFHDPGVVFLKSRADVDSYLNLFQDYVDSTYLGPNDLLLFYDLESVGDEFFKTYSMILIPIVEGSGSISNKITGVSVIKDTVTVHIDRFVPNFQTDDLQVGMRAVVVKNSDIKGAAKATTAVTTTSEEQLAAADPFYYYASVTDGAFGYRRLKCVDSFEISASKYWNFNISAFAENGEFSELNPSIVVFKTKAEVDTFLDAASSYFRINPKTADDTFLKDLYRIPEEHFEENVIILIYLKDSSQKYTVFSIEDMTVDGSHLTVVVSRLEDNWNSSYYHNTQFLISVSKNDIKKITSFDTKVMLLEKEVQE